MGTINLVCRNGKRGVGTVNGKRGLSLTFLEKVLLLSSVGLDSSFSNDVSLSTGRSS